MDIKQQIKDQYKIIDVYNPEWQYAARIILPISGIIYILSIPLTSHILPDYLIISIILLYIFFHIYLRKQVRKHGFQSRYDIYGSAMDIISSCFGWLVDPYDPSAFFFFALVSIIGNNIQHGMKNFRPVHFLTAVLVPCIYIIRLFIFGFNPSSFFILFFSFCLVCYIFVIVIKIEELKTQSKKWSKELEQVNKRLVSEIDERKKIEQFLRDSENKLRKYKNQLEIRVMERTSELLIANNKLKQEIEEREQTEKQLKESEEKYRRLFINVSDYVYLIDLEGNILETNAALKNEIAINEEELKKMNLIDFIEPKYKKDFNRNLKRIIDIGQSSGMMNVELKNGRKMAFEYNNTLIKNRNNEPVAIQGTARDVTKRLEAEKELTFVHQRLLDIIEFLPDAMFVIDENKKIITWNKALEEMTGFKQEEMIGKGNYEYAIPFYSDRRPIVCDFIFDNYPEFESNYLFIERNENTIYAEVFVPYLYNGKGAYVWAKASALYDQNGNLRGAIQSIRDISKRKKAEKEARERLDQLYHADRMTTLGTLVAGVAHEINNPITSIMLNAPALQELWNLVLPILDEYYSVREDCQGSGMTYQMVRERVPILLESINNGAERVSNIVSELKDFSREKPPEMTDMVDINDVVIAAVGLVQNLIKKSTDNFKENFADIVPRFKGNKQRIEQVVINLLVNACQALPDKTKKISITTGYNDSNGNVFLEVIDEGHGIDPELVQRIKDPFFTTKRNSGGTGLGLAISDKIIQNHNGSLFFTSETGTGTTARIEIPVH